MKSEKLYKNLLGQKGCKLRTVNWGKLPRAWLFRCLLAFPHPQRCGYYFLPGVDGGGGTSPEALITCFRRRSESFLHVPLCKLLQLKIFSMPRHRVLGEHVLNPLELWQNCSDMDVRNCALHFGVLILPFPLHTHTQY